MSIDHIFTKIPCTGMTTRLWNFVSTFSNLSGERLHQIYSKLKQEQDEEVGPSHINGSASGPFGRDGDSTSFSHHAERQRGYKSINNQMSEPLKGFDTAKFEAWKRRRRGETDSPFQRLVSNGTRLADPNSVGILGAGPSENRRSVNEKPYKTRQNGLPPR